MFSSLGTKLAMRKMGIPKDALSWPAAEAAPAPKKGAVDVSPDADEVEQSAWPKWMSAKSLPLTAQAWLSPNPPPVPVAPECPRLGEIAPVDRDGKLALVRGKKVVIVFLRCVGCAFAQKTFLALRDLSSKAQFSGITCIAVSHSSAAATQKWLDLIGGAWNVQVIIDEDRAIYATWGLGVSSVWYYFNPATQTAAWREKGWLGSKVAMSIARGGGVPAGTAGGNKAADDMNEGPGIGNKWQQGGAFAVDDRGYVVWGGKAQTADEVMDLAAGFRTLGR